MGNYFSQSKVPQRVYGYRPDKPDSRDYTREFTTYSFTSDNSVDLRNHCPPPYDQGKLGSCTANAIAAAYHFDEMLEGEPCVFQPSRLFIYYNERALENTVDTDAGASLRDGIKTINSNGVCPETLWEYDITKFTVKPSSQCYEDATRHRAVEYHRLNQDLDQLRECLTQGIPFVFGFTVYESFESPEVAKTGIMPMPQANERALGGHAVMAVGYDDVKKCFIVRNSWGEGWGDKGYFYMPYEFMTDANQCQDFWTVVRVQDDE